jgi:hypothetical protein
MHRPNSFQLVPFQWPKFVDEVPSCSVARGPSVCPKTLSMNPNVKVVLKHVEPWLENFCISLMYPVVEMARKFVGLEGPQSETAQVHGSPLPTKKVSEG